VSSIKKAVIYFILGTVLMLLATTANASTELSGSGEFFNVDEEVTLNLDIDHRAEFDGWQYVVEGDIYYAEENSTKEEQSVYSQFKLNKDISEKTYLLGVLQVDYDKFRDYEYRTVFFFGFVIKIYKSDRWKISNESTIAYLEGDDTEVILRNSIWVSYILSDRISLTNKALYESSNETYIRIETELAYKINDKFSISINNEHTEDYEKEDILTFNFKLTL
jgi:putative salt-induced outer membrane protein YdiY